MFKMDILTFCSQIDYKKTPKNSNKIFKNSGSSKRTNETSCNAHRVATLSKVYPTKNCKKN